MIKPDQLSTVALKMEIDAQREENSDSEIDIVNCSDSTEDTSPGE